MENAYNPPPYGWTFPLTPQATAPATLPRPVARVKPLQRRSDDDALLLHIAQPRLKLPESKLKKAATVVGPESTHMICSDCSHEIDTVTNVKPGETAYKCGVLLFILGCVCGCCLIPCCMDTCMDVHHTCPECGTHLGRYHRN